MNKKEKTLAYIKCAENNLQYAKLLLEQENPDNFFSAMQQVEFAKDSLSDASAVLRDEL